MACIKLILNGKFLDNDEVLAGEMHLVLSAAVARLSSVTTTYFAAASFASDQHVCVCTDLQRTLTDPAEHSVVTMHCIVRPQATLKAPGAEMLLRKLACRLHEPCTAARSGPSLATCTAAGLLASRHSLVPDGLVCDTAQPSRRTRTPPRAAAASSADATHKAKDCQPGLGMLTCWWSVSTGASRAVRPLGGCECSTV